MIDGFTVRNELIKVQIIVRILNKRKVKCIERKIIRQHRSTISIRLMVFFLVMNIEKGEKVHS